MKTMVFKMAIVALFVIAGSWSSSAQIGRGGTCLRNSTSTVVEKPATCTTLQLTEDQLAILSDLRADYLAAMAELRTAMWSASWADKLGIRQQMIDLRNAHIAEVKALLEEWGY